MPSRFLLVLAVIFLACGMGAGPALAETATPEPGTAVTAEQANPEAFIQQLGDKAVGILGNKGVTPEERDSTFRELMHQSFDLPTIARFVIGRNAWQGATAEEKTEYLELFEKLVMRIYSDRFAMYSGEGFKVANSRTEGERDTIVNSHIMRPDSDQPVVVNWRVRNFDGRLAIIDVIVEGISMSVTQRQEYSSVLQRNDNNLRPLLTLMHDSLSKQDKQDKKE